MRIAVIGSGVSGNLAARLLSSRHEVDLFESASHVGGHAQTVDVEVYGRHVSADVAFMVLNRRTYPNFCEVLDRLGIETRDSDMSLSVRCFRSGLEFQGSSLNGLFAQRSNLCRPSFYRMLWDILKFNRRAVEFCEANGDDSQLLGQFLDQIGVGSAFREHYLLPMSAAIWSADPTCLTRFPARFILGFFRNHGLLQLRDRPQWMTIAGGSRRYVEALTRPFADRIRINSPVRAVRRIDAMVEVTLQDGVTETYDHAVLATHADQTLRLLTDGRADVREILRGFPYQANQAILHTDLSILPRRRRAWASWNYHIPKEPSGQVSVTYDLNRLQGLGLPGPLCLTLNPNCEIDPSSILRSFDFQHPVFCSESIEAQRRFDEINGRDGISYCGAYWGYGFHEDGVRSALAVASRFGLGLEDLDRHSMVDSFPLDSHLAGV